MVLAKVRSGAVYGVDAYPVEIEVNAGHGDPKIIIVGLPDAAVKESGDRVMTALINSGFAPPMGRTTINLAPADIKKEGPSFDLPIALGMIAAQGDIEKETLNELCVIGELALSGEVRRVRGVLPIAIQARAEGCRGILVPAENADEAAVVEGLIVYPVQTLRQAADFLAGQAVDRAVPGERGERVRQPQSLRRRFRGRQRAGVRQARARSGLAGGHNLLDRRPAGHRQDDAGQARAVDPSSDDAGGGAGDDEDPQHRRRAAAAPGAGRPAAVPHAASHDVRRGPARRRLASGAGRGEPRAPRRAVSRRDAGVSPERAGSHAPAARGRRGHDFARGDQRDLSVPVHAGGGDEPVPVRVLRRPEARVPVFAAADSEIPEPDFRSAAGPDRHPRGSARPSATRICPPSSAASRPRKSASA